MTADKVKYEIADSERKKHVDAILASPSNKKIVAAGPGTGKTNLFKRILEGKENTLTLTFVNSLVEDLSLELCGLSDVRTLHGFARSILSKAIKDKEFKIFPNLGKKVIKKDAKILLDNKEIDFDSIFHNRDDNNEHIEFYKNRKDYYNHHGFSDIVFAAVKYFEKYPDKIPNFEQVVVDEFQDFNELEVSLIDILVEQSPILLAGDDDQALYGWKDASTKHIRQRHSEDNPNYAPFKLPYCSRCTRVIVDATNDIINRAKEQGHLSNRIKKPFRYFDHKDQDKVSDKNPQIIYRPLQASQIPPYIGIDILEIAKQVRDKFSVLIICPYNIHCETVANALKKKGFVNVSFKEKEDAEELTLLDGLKLLLKEPSCNLGWRIVAEKMLGDIEFETLIKQTNENKEKKVFDLIEQPLKNEAKQLLQTLRAVRDGKEIKDESKLADLFNKVDIDASKMARDYLKDEIESCQPPSKTVIPVNRAIRKIPITITTTQGSKGLDADYVFITFFDDQYFVEDKDKTKISDQDICKFLVALTRARKKAFLYSSDVNKKPVFLEWINEKRIEKIKAKASTQSAKHDG